MSLGLSVIIIAIVVAIVVVAGIVALVMWVASRGRPKPWQAPTEPAEHTVITLQITAGDPEDPAVQRLVQDAAVRQFAAHTQVQSVEVRRADGMVLGTVLRDAPMRPAADLPDSLRVQHAPRRHGPSVTGSGSAPRRPVDVDPSDFASSDKLFAEQFDLPDAVRERITDPANPTQVVAAILDHAGVAHRTEPGLLVAGDTAIVLVGDGSGHTVTSDDLAKAFLRFDSAHVREGVAVCLGYVSPQELHRRELLAPNLRHAGPEAIQRMADALRLGGDPVMFATGPG